MAEAKLVLGGELDIASGKELDSATSLIRRDILGLKSDKPIIRPLMGSVPSAAAGTNIAYFAQTPPEWAEWHVLQYAIGINDDHTVASGVTAALYTGDPFNPMLGTCRLPGRPVPDSQDFGEKRIIVHSGEYVFWVFYGVAANSLIWTNMMVAEAHLHSREMQHI